MFAIPNTIQTTNIMLQWMQFAAYPLFKYFGVIAISPSFGPPVSIFGSDNSPFLSPTFLLFFVSGEVSFHLFLNAKLFKLSQLSSSVALKLSISVLHLLVDVFYQSFTTTIFFLQLCIVCFSRLC
jgi:hypothetical protein